METKTCSKCGVEKPKSRFYPRVASNPLSPLRSNCKDCQNTSRRGTKRNKHKGYKQYNKEWRKDNPEKYAGQQRRYDQRYPDKYREKAARRRARQRSVTVENVDYNQIRLRDSSCYLCGRDFSSTERWDGQLTHIDHKIPLSKPELGSTHSYENCALVHKECNLKKGDRAA